MVDVCGIIEEYHVLREVAKMVTRSNLDALSPGMMAKLDPLSRLAKERGTARWVSAVKSESGVASFKYASRPVDRQKKREELKTGMAGY